MSSITERVRALPVSLDAVIVIGSGLLDALGLRPSRDLDLVVAPSVFQQLQTVPGYALMHKGKESFLENDDIEVWLDWGGLDFEAMKKDAMIVDGVQFVNPHFLIAQKRLRGTPKDINDIALLETYLHER